VYQAIPRPDEVNCKVHEMLAVQESGSGPAKRIIFKYFLCKTALLEIIYNAISYEKEKKNIKLYFYSFNIQIQFIIIFKLFSLFFLSDLAPSILHKKF